MGYDHPNVPRHRYDTPEVLRLLGSFVTVPIMWPLPVASVLFGSVLLIFSFSLPKFTLERSLVLLMVFMNARDFQSRYSLLCTIKVSARTRINGILLFDAKPGTTGSRRISKKLSQEQARQRTNIVVTVLIMPGKYLAEAGSGNLCKQSG